MSRKAIAVLVEVRGGVADVVNYTGAAPFLCEVRDMDNGDKPFTRAERRAANKAARIAARALNKRKTRRTLRPFSVLLEYWNGDQMDTFYAWVRARTEDAALEAAAAQAARRLKMQPEDFERLLMLRGHRQGV